MKVKRFLFVQSLPFETKQNKTKQNIPSMYFTKTLIRTFDFPLPPFYKTKFK